MESSVASLMEHLNGVETRRRIVMMKRKEAEAKLSFVTEEQQSLEQQRSANELREAELKKELDHLLEEQRQIQLQLMTGADTIRQSEVEETLLMEHVQSQVSKSEALVEEWSTHLEALEKLQKAWETDNVAAPLVKHLEELEEESTKLHNRNEQLESSIKEAVQANNTRIAAMTTSAPVPTGSPTVQKSTEDHDVAVAQLMERLELEMRDLDELRAQNARQIAAVDREVTDLIDRSTELGQWLGDTITSRDQTLANIQLLPKCLASSFCVSCSTAL
ncbi:unnamed protein product [Trypanosoma congolense IL3000]|uniref:WGS project CAEQ00000000 data, annotated contig 2268 n=1 Tax=Trypanosoma congolense (strain IL3000) TaxID=1068625 RepID=F9WCU1_TRYCI|nr:unnamed protein product [Trypanosoma congolense IL3000]